MMNGLIVIKQHRKQYKSVQKTRFSFISSTVHGTNLLHSYTLLLVFVSTSASLPF